MSALPLAVRSDSRSFTVVCDEACCLLIELSEACPEAADARCDALLSILNGPGSSFRINRLAAGPADEPVSPFTLLQGSKAFRVLRAAIGAAHGEAMLPNIHGLPSPSLVGASMVNESPSGANPDGDDIAVSVFQPLFAVPLAIYLGHLSDYELESLLFVIHRSARMQVRVQAFLKVGQFVGPSTGDVLDQRSEPVDFGPGDRIADVVQGCADHLSVNSAQKGRAIGVHGSYPGGEADCDIQEHVTERSFVGANCHRDLPRSEGKTQDSTEAQP